MVAFLPPSWWRERRPGVRDSSKPLRHKEERFKAFIAIRPFFFVTNSIQLIVLGTTKHSVAMASPQAQARANALNARLEGNAQTAIDEIERLYIRPVARKAHVCAVQCYDKAGNNGSVDALDACVRTCQTSHQQANDYLQNVRE
jgi:hypothetical protein